MACPICGEETRKDWRPFCSRRCADRDLGRWLKGSYSIPMQSYDEADTNAEDDDMASSRIH